MVTVKGMCRTDDCKLLQYMKFNYDDMQDESEDELDAELLADESAEEEGEMEGMLM